MKMKTIQELENIGYTVCDFSNCCDVCDNPKGKSFAVNHTNDMSGQECDSYICQKCATKTFEERLRWIEN